MYFKQTHKYMFIRTKGQHMRYKTLETTFKGAFVSYPYQSEQNKKDNLTCATVGSVQRDNVS